MRNKYLLFFETLLLNLELAGLTRLAGQQAQGVLLSPPAQGWDYRRVQLPLVFLSAFVSPTQGFMLELELSLLTEPCLQSNFYKRQYLVQQILPVYNLD